MKDNTLNRISWDHCLMHSYFDFLRTEGNYIQIGKGKALKPGIKYRFTDAPNRNLKIDTHLWKVMIYNHFLKHNSN